MPTCRCWGWTSCLVSDMTVDSLCTDTCRCRGWAAGSPDTPQRTHSHTALRPSAAQWDTASHVLDLHIGTHLGEESVLTQRINKSMLDIAFCTTVRHCWSYQVLTCFCRYLLNNLTPHICVYFFWLNPAWLLSEWQRFSSEVVCINSKCETEVTWLLKKSGRQHFSGSNLDSRVLRIR